jgi:DNA polymerase-3 subunit alpha
MDILTQTVTHFSGQLSEANPTERVRVAGVITRLRHHQSKAGKQMGFVTLEDLQGAIELVVFPRTWEKFAGIIKIDTIVMAEGRVDASGAEPKLLVDTISTELKVTSPVGSPDAYSPSGRSSELLGDNVRPDRSLAQPPPSPVNIAEPASSYQAVDEEGPVWMPPDDEEDPYPGDQLPPPPDLFPPDWEWSDRDRAAGAASYTTGVQPGPSSPEPEVKSPSEGSRPPDAPEPAAVVVEAVFTGSQQGPVEPVVQEVEQPVPQVPRLSIQEPAAILPQADPQPDRPQVEKPGFLPTGYLVSPPPNLDTNASVRMLTIVLRSTGDKTRDVLRLRRIHGRIISYPGIDRFAFQVFERGRFYLLEFPNFTAGINNELLAWLSALVGPDNVRIEPITFQ